MMDKIHHLLSLLLVLLLSLPPGVSMAAPAAKLWPYFDTSDASSNRSIDHSHWDRFLKKYVVVQENGLHLVD